MPDLRDVRLAALFSQVFGTPITARMLEWKYGDERGRCTGVFEEERLVAHCGVTFRRAMVEGVCVTVEQIGDLMATGSKPGGLAREQSAFHLLLKQVFDAMPQPANPQGIAYGFPSARAMRLAQRLGMVLDVDLMHELHFSPRAGAGSMVELDVSSARCAALARRLWREMAAGLGHGLVCVRDEAYLRWRYALHPTHSYRFFALRSRWSWRPSMLAVCRTEEDRWELMDLIGHPTYMPQALRVLQACMADHGAGSLMLWLTRAHAQRLGGLADKVQPLQFHIIANPASCPGQPGRFVDRWWLTAGDTDYR